jgi:hypothetical protein
MKIEINISDYLSEDDKIEIAKDAFKELVKTELITQFEQDKRTQSKRMKDYERIVSNAIFYYLESEIDSLIDSDTKELIKNGVLKTISKQDYNYSLFRSKTAWDSEISPAQAVVIEAINESRESMKEKIKSKFEDNINNIDTDQMTDIIYEIVSEVINTKLKS